jgi:hypothetical protein
MQQLWYTSDELQWQFLGVLKILCQDHQRLSITHGFCPRLWDAVSKNMQYYSSYERPRYFKTEIATWLLCCIQFICYIRNLKCTLFVLTDHRMYFNDSDTYPRTNNILFHTQVSTENLLQSELSSKRSSHQAALNHVNVHRIVLTRLFII